MADTPEFKLSPEAHKQVFEQKILNNPKIVVPEATSQAHPKAVVLAGQPGAGKGRVADAVADGFQKNVVTIDPDVLRDKYPNVDTLKQQNPYTWSDATHEDASAWSKELRAEMIAQRKNILIDGTNPKPEVIKQLQAAGYEVEVRVVATHQLESVLGVEERYAKSVAKDGHGRYVPPSIQEPIYNELPSSLDKVREQFPDVQMRIYNRDGFEQYDSHSQKDFAKKPSIALVEAREAALLKEGKLQELSAKYERSIHQGQNLTQILTDNPKVDNALINTHIEERTKLNAQGYLEKAVGEVHQRVQTISHTTQKTQTPNPLDEPRPLSQKLIPFQQAYQRDQLDQTFEQKTIRPHSVDTKHINGVLQGEQKHSIEYQTEQAAKARQIQLERAAEIHPQTTHSKTQHLAGKVIGAAGVAVEAGLGYIEVKDAIKQANSTREQYVKGIEAGGNAAVKSAVTGVAGLGGGIVGGAGGAITPVPGGAAIGAIGVGGAAAYGAGELYEDSASQRAVKAVSRGAGEFAYDHISKEGRLAGDIRELKEQISQTTDPAKTRALNEQLNQTTQAFNVEADKNARQIGAEHALEAARTDIKKDNPKLWNVSLDSQLDRAVEQGYSGNEAVRIAVGNAAARDTNVSAVHSDQLRTLAQNANFNAKQADIQSVTDALSNGRAMNYERQQAVERKVMASEWRDVQSVTDVLTAARNGELKLNPVHKVEHHYVKTVVTHKPMGLHQGDHGENVKQLQNALKLLGADIEADGHFGKSTTQALKDFQKEHHLKVDGELDRKTGQTLVKELKALDAQPTNTIQEPSVQASQPISISPEQQPQIDRMLAVMAQNPALAGLSREEQTTMAMGLINAAVDKPAPTQTAEVKQPEALSVPQSQPNVASQAATSAAVTTEAPVSLNKVQQGHVDQILGLMAEKPEFKAFNPEQQTQMAMGLMIEAHQRGEPMDKLQGIYLPQNGQTLAAQFDTPIGMVHLPTSDALKTTPQQLVEAHNPQVSQQQVLQQQLQQSQSTRDPIDVQGVSMPRSNMPIEFAAPTSLSRTQQGHVDLILERMAENPAFATYPAEQRTQMAMGLMVEAAKRGEPMDRLQGVYLPQNGQTLAAQFDTPIGIVHLPTQEALQTAPQDVTIAQNNQVVQQQQQEQQRAVEREQSQGRGMSLG